MRFSVTTGEAGGRLDVVLVARSGLTRAEVQRALRAGRVTVGDHQARAGQRLRAGDIVSARLEPDVTEPPGPEDIPLVIRYSDERVLVVSKPAGLVTHPGHGHASGTLVNALLGLGGALSGAGSERPGIVHRLDKDTSGLLLVARDDEAHELLGRALRRRDIERRYLALVRGVPASATGTIDAPVGRHPARRTRMTVTPTGRAAVTHYRVLSAGDGQALLELRLETGRTHQIRVHLAHLGHAVLGDRAYGGMTERAAALGLVRPFLHACGLSFPHPEDGRIVTVTDPLPADLAAALAAAGLTLPADDFGRTAP